MGIYFRVVLFAICLVIVPACLFAQNDICSTLPSVGSTAGGTPAEVVVEQMKERAEIQARQERDRVTWSVQMFPVKYLDSADTLKALCIFSAEIVPQPALHMISVRADQANMSAIGDAIKHLDVPQVGPRSVELTIQVLVASDQDEMLKPVPASLKAVVDQLKGVLSYKQFFSLDTLLGTTVDGHHVSFNGSVPGPMPAATSRAISYQFGADLRIASGESATAPVRLSALRFSLADVFINTDVDIPQGKQVVVGKSTSGDRAYILVVSAKILN